ncbi:SWI/SNF complex subunit SWI3A [Platanthera guangdongensis]|uniref:SWI/SNF complex subunit SWI3A n=1 Tax=Platanthera guangdongensis TaxID=2320717 RepID=A0ABR2LE66_9ASPA
MSHGVEADLSNRRFRERELYTIPISSSWFRWDEIHEYERRSLPGFFEGGSYSRSPRVYKEYRDFIINKFREDPSRRLAFTEVRKSLVGDVYTLQKVFIFLEKSGLVNFNLSDRKQHQQHAEDDEPIVMVEDGPAAGVRVVPTLFSSSFAAAGQNGEEATFKLPPLASYSDSFVKLNSSSDLICGLCGGHYHSGLNESSEGDIKMCSKCSSKDMGNENPELDLAQNKYTDVKDCSSTAWTDAETLLLLEAVLKHGDDWDLIAQHVRTKHKLDCISRLIHLPFGEHILGAIATKSSNINLITLLEEYKSGMQVLNDKPAVLTEIDVDEQVEIIKEEEEERGIQEQPSNQKCFPPFIDAIDSFMKQVASLSTLCGQDVASAAVDAAITALCQENPCARLAFETTTTTTNKPLSLHKSEFKSVIKFEDEDAKGNTHADYVPEKSFSAKTFQIRAGIATSLALAAARAKLIADQEEKEMELLIASIIQAQLKKLQHKMKHLKEAGVILEKELAYLQPLKESMMEDWVSVLQKLFQAGTPQWRDQSFPKTMLHTFPL